MPAWPMVVFRWCVPIKWEELAWVVKGADRP